MRLVAFLSVSLVFTARVVHGNFFNVTYLTPDQCGPFEVYFQGPTTPTFPLSITVAPISSNPITIRIPDDAWNNSTQTGAASVTFLPFSSGTQFIASLDDGNGNSLGFVSDILAVNKSDSSSCLVPQRSTNFYGIHGEFDQCSHFNVSFNPKMVDNQPTIRAFLPRSFSFFVNATSSTPQTITFNPNDRGNNSSDNNNNSSSSNNDKDNSNKGSNNNGNGDKNINGSKEDDDKKGAKNITFQNQEYVLDVIHGFQVVLLLDDQSGHRETSKLYTVGGSSSSSSGCFKETFNTPSTPSSLGPPFSNSNRRGSISK
jgi:hypothetical protein